jgi:hypothetical protein
MKEEYLQYADEILISKPNNAFEYRIFNRVLSSEENPSPTFPDWQSDLLLKLVDDGLLSRKFIVDTYDS